MKTERFFDALTQWAARRSDIAAVALVGSHARDAAGPDSDIDVVLVCADPRAMLDEPMWRSVFGEIERTEQEDWGLVQSLRTFYRNGPEVEFGITGTSWTNVPVDPGTQEVVSHGMKILYDPQGLLVRLKAAVAQRAPSSA